LIIVMSKIDREKIAKDWISRGFTCDLWIDPPGERWENFLHEVDEVVMVVEGKMEFEVEGKVYQPRIGDELLIPARAIHSSRNIGNTTALWLYGYKLIH